MASLYQCTACAPGRAWRADPAPSQARSRAPQVASLRKPAPPRLAGRWSSEVAQLDAHARSEASTPRGDRSPHAGSPRGGGRSPLAWGSPLGGAEPPRPRSPLAGASPLDAERAGEAPATRERLGARRGRPCRAPSVRAANSFASWH
jgi:hypothetical protein